MIWPDGSAGDWMTLAADTAYDLAKGEPPVAVAVPLIWVIVRPASSKLSLLKGAKLTGVSSLVVTLSSAISATAKMVPPDVSESVRALPLPVLPLSLVTAVKETAPL